jgi:hypothetical protein
LIKKCTSSTEFNVLWFLSPPFLEYKTTSFSYIRQKYRLMRYVILMMLAFAANVSFSQGIDWLKVKTPGIGVREIGPALTSGRVADILVHPENQDTWYIAVASGGIWKTENHGITFNPIFDTQGSYSIACLAMDPNNPNVIWAGTGENNGQRSVAYGDGVYKSEDGGKSWNNMGLKNSEHIGRIWVNPNNSNEVWVAAQGPLWNSGGERGLYKTTNGGKSWELALNVDAHTGISDLVVDPRNNGMMYAAAWQRQRKVWTFISGGPASALYVSKDWGVTWEKAKSGFPQGEIGRIGLAISPVNPEKVFAIVEANGGKEGFYATADRGASWTKKSKTSTSGNYYQEIYCDPIREDVIYVMDTYGQISYNGGTTFERIQEKNKHVDNHAIWVNPANRNHWVMGCDGGLYETYDEGAKWDFKANLPVCQFYKIAADNKKPFYTVYGGTQDNYSLGGPSQTRSSNGIRNSDWFVTNGGDGFQSAVDPTDPNTVYSQAQYGYLVRFNRKTGEKIGIQPQNRADLPAFRWNWDAPLLVSSHNAKTLYFAANHVFKSTNRGSSWEVISPDLSRNEDRSQLQVMDRFWADGTVAWNKSTSDYGNITAMAESPVNAQELWVGTDDGLIHRSTNGGSSWKKWDGIPGAPKKVYVNDIYINAEGSVFVVLNNHKNGDFKPYIYSLAKNGKSWTSVSSDLPQRGSVYAYVEDGEIAFAGTEFGAFYSLNQGENWKKVDGLPTIAVRDIVLQADEKDAIFGTFGRGMWVMDDYSRLAALPQQNEGLIVPGSSFPWYVQSSELGRSGNAFQGASLYAAANPEPGVTFTYYLTSVEKNPKKARKAAYSKDGSSPSPFPTEAQLKAERDFDGAKIKVEIVDINGKYVHHIWKKAAKGVQSHFWNFRLGSDKAPDKLKFPYNDKPWGALVLPGEYSAQLYLLDSKGLQKKGSPIQFQIAAIDGQTQADFAAIGTFREDVQILLDEVSVMSDKLKALKKKLTIKQAEMFAQKQWNPAEKSQLHELEAQWQNLNEAFYGDKLMPALYETVKEGLRGRTGTLNYRCFMTTSTITESMRKLYADLRVELESFNESLGQLEKQF